MWDEIPTLEELEAAIDDPGQPIGKRMRAAYYLRHLHDTEPAQQAAVIEILASGLRNSRHDSLMRHEFAYVLGQLKDELACDVLEETLAQEHDCVMVRHECAEALGAIGKARSKRVLQSVMETNPDLPELSETCHLALNVMKWREGNNDDHDDEQNMPPACACMLSPYNSVDPAPPHPQHADMSIADIGAVLSDINAPMFERYRAMFSLRNLGSADAVQELCRTLTHDTSSALLRHEVAYVLGQLQRPDSVDALVTSLRRSDEHVMVRHESAEALGAIDGRWSEVEAILREFVHDDSDVVRESCLVALDAAEYWGHHDNEHADSDENGATEQVVPRTLPSFAQQKKEPSRILANHFNIATPT